MKKLISLLLVAGLLLTGCGFSNIGESGSIFNKIAEDDVTGIHWIASTNTEQGRQISKAPDIVFNPNVYQGEWKTYYNSSNWHYLIFDDNKFTWYFTGNKKDENNFVSGTWKLKSNTTMDREDNEITVPVILLTPEIGKQNGKEVDFIDKKTNTKREGYLEVHEIREGEAHFIGLNPLSNNYKSDFYANKVLSPEYFEISDKEKEEYSKKAIDYLNDRLNYDSSTYTLNKEFELEAKWNPTSPSDYNFNSALTTWDRKEGKPILRTFKNSKLEYNLLHAQVIDVYKLNSRYVVLVHIVTKKSSEESNKKPDIHYETSLGYVSFYSYGTRSSFAIGDWSSREPIEATTKEKLSKENITLVEEFLRTNDSMKNSTDIKYILGLGDKPSAMYPNSNASTCLFTYTDIYGEKRFGYARVIVNNNHDSDYLTITGVDIQLNN